MMCLGAPFRTYRDLVNLIYASTVLSFYTFIIPVIYHRHFTLRRSSTITISRLTLSSFSELTNIECVFFWGAAGSWLFAWLLTVAGPLKMRPLGLWPNHLVYGANLGAVVGYSLSIIFFICTYCISYFSKQKNKNY